MTIARVKLSRIIATFALVIASCCRAVAEETPPQVEGDASLYQPTEGDFRSAYGQDKENQPRQSWKEYWGWIDSFYKGNAFDAGWTKRSGEVVGKVADEKTKKRVRRELNSLGRRIAAEWAKDNAVRKIDTAAVSSWGKRLLKAKNEDDGSGSKILSAIADIRRDADAKLPKQP